MSLNELLRRVWHLLNRRRLERELREEMEAHRELMVKPEHFGNALRLREESRDVWGWNWLDDLWRDIRFGLRALKHSVGFSLGAFLILSLGIGVNVANFQALDILFWSPPKIRDPASLVRFDLNSRNRSFRTVPYPLTLSVASNKVLLSAVLVRVDASSVGGVNWGDGAGGPLRASFVSANWFSELDYRPLRGRVFQEGIDDVADAQPVVVISRGFWENRLSQDPNILGKTLKINNRMATVVGIVPPNVVPQHDSTVWMPVTQIDYFVPGSPVKTSWNFQISRAELYGRLRPGISMAATREASKGLLEELAAQHPEQVQAGAWLEPYSGITRFREPSMARRDALYFIPIGAALTLLILLIACANLSNIILSRTVSRVRELSIRSALGASRWRIVRHLMSESVVLVVIGAAGGLALVYWMSRITRAFWEYAPDFTPDLRTVFASLFAVGITIAAVGLLPALKLSRADLANAMKDGGFQSSAVLSRTRWKHFLLAAQLSGSCILLVLTGLMLRSVQRVLTDVGFDVEKVAVMTVPLQAHGIAASEALSYWSAARDAVASQAEAEAAALVERSVLNNGSSMIRSVDGRLLMVNEVEPAFFKVMRIPLLAGRTFSDSDEFRTTVIVSKSLALGMYGTLDVLGKGFPKGIESKTIVGIVGDARLQQNEEAKGAGAYAPLNPGNSERMLLVRAKSDAKQLILSMKGTAQSLDDRATPDAHLLADDLARRAGDSRAMSMLMSALASLALALTSVGVFGMVSYAASMRRKELGIRMALGATRRSILFALVRDVRWSLLGGIVFGLPVAVSFAGVFAGPPLFVKAFDMRILAMVCVFLLIVTGIAAIFPAWRALRSDLLDSLRCE